MLSSPGPNMKITRRSWKWLFFLLLISPAVYLFFQQYQDAAYIENRYQYKISNLNEAQAKYEDYVTNRDKRLAELEEIKQRHQQEVLAVMPGFSDKEPSDSEESLRSIFNDSGVNVVDLIINHQPYSLLNDYTWELEGLADAIRKALAQVDNLPRMVDWLEIPTALEQAAGPFKGRVKVRFHYFLPIPEREKHKIDWDAASIINDKWEPDIWLPILKTKAAKAKESYKQELSRFLARRKSDPAAEEIITEAVWLEEMIADYNTYFSTFETVTSSRISLGDIYSLAKEPDPGKQAQLRKDLINSRRRLQIPPSPPRSNNARD